MENNEKGYTASEMEKFQDKHDITIKYCKDSIKKTKFKIVTSLVAGVIIGVVTVSGIQYAKNLVGVKDSKEQQSNALFQQLGYEVHFIPNEQGLGYIILDDGTGIESEELWVVSNENNEIKFCVKKLNKNDNGNYYDTLYDLKTLEEVLVLDYFNENSDYNKKLRTGYKVGSLKSNDVIVSYDKNNREITSVYFNKLNELSEDQNGKSK